MSYFVTLLADLLVAVLLVATIVTSLRLSRRIAGLKSDEAAMRKTIGDLVVATTTAERAITGLRATLDECDRTLAGRLEAAERGCADLTRQVEAGEGVVARIGAIVAQARPARGAAADEPIAPSRATEPALVVSNADRLAATLNAAQALSERALERIRAKAA